MLPQERVDKGEHSIAVADLTTELGRIYHVAPPADDRLCRDTSNVVLQQAMLLHEKVPNNLANQVTLEMMSYDWRRARTAHRARYVVRTNSRKHMEKELGITDEDKVIHAQLMLGVPLRNWHCDSGRGKKANTSRRGRGKPNIVDGKIVTSFIDVVILRPKLPNYLLQPKLLVQWGI